MTPYARRNRHQDAPVEGVLERPLGRDLSAPELRAFVDGLAARPDLWEPLARPDADRRVCERLVADEHVAAWLICWMPAHDTGFHDHDVSRGAVAVVRGR